MFVRHVPKMRSNILKQWQFSTVQTKITKKVLDIKNSHLLYVKDA